MRAEYRSWSETAPPVRAEKVVEAKLRIARGAYDGEAARLETIGSLLRELRPPARRGAASSRRRPRGARSPARAPFDPRPRPAAT